MQHLIDKIVLVTWKDAKSELGTSLGEFVKRGFVINNSVGWLKLYDEEKVVLCSEKAINADDSDDFTMIPTQWIIDIKELSNNKLKDCEKCLLEWRADAFAYRDECIRLKDYIKKYCPKKLKKCSK